MKTFELKQEIEAKNAQLQEKLEARDLEGSKALDQEIRDLEELLHMQEEQEAREMKEIKTQKTLKTEGNDVKMVNEMRALTKQVMGATLTEEERASIKTADHAAVLPKQFINQLQEYKKGFGSLKEYCDIIPVTKNEGTIPVANLDQNTFPEVVEGDNIVDGTLVTSDVAFKCAKHGLIQSLTSELVDDAEIEIEGLVRRNFAEIVTVAENTKITKVIKDNATAVVGAASYEDVQKAIDTAVPGVKNGLATFTNVSGYALLKNMKDTQKRPLNLVTEVGDKYYFHGKELVVVDDTLMPAASGKNVFYVCNPRELIKYCDRKSPTIARSTEAGFKDDTVKVRILERFAVIKGVVRHCLKLEF